MAKPKGLTREEKSARAKELSDRLIEFSESLNEDDRAEYVARFDHYSPRNALLIIMQREDATVVRGYQQWKAEGRQVRKGEHGIIILAPAGSREVKRDDDADPELRRFFRQIAVFDISQTDDGTGEAA